MINAPVVVDVVSVVLVTLVTPANVETPDVVTVSVLTLRVPTPTTPVILVPSPRRVSALTSVQLTIPTMLLVFSYFFATKIVSTSSLESQHTKKSIFSNCVKV